MAETVGRWVACLATGTERTAYPGSTSKSGKPRNKPKLKKGASRTFSVEPEAEEPGSLVSSIRKRVRQIHDFFEKAATRLESLTLVRSRYVHHVRRFFCFASLLSNLGSEFRVWVRGREACPSRLV